MAQVFSAQTLTRYSSSLFQSRAKHLAEPHWGTLEKFNRRKLNNTTKVPSRKPFDFAIDSVEETPMDTNLVRRYKNFNNGRSITLTTDGCIFHPTT